MSTSTLVLILISSIGFLSSSLFSIYLLKLKKNRSTLELLLGGLLLVLSIRIGKSVFNNFTDLPIVLKNIGLVANLAIGPFLLLYGTVLIQGSSLQKKDGWHFLPAALYVLFSPVIPNQLGDTLWYVSYSFVILQQLGYIGWSALFIRDWTSNWAIVTHRGFIILWTTVALIWLTYLLIFLGLIPVYLFGALAYSFLVLLLFYFVTKEGQALLPREKYVQQPLSNQESAQYLAMIRNKMETDKSYLNPDLTIQQLSQELKLPAKLISRVINEQLRLNFSAFINSYRIEEAKRRLKSAAYRPYTIASIAYDCGFNSISSFNTTFKVMTQQTPSQFRKAFLHPSV